MLTRDVILYAEDLHVLFSILYKGFNKHLPNDIIFGYKIQLIIAVHYHLTKSKHLLVLVTTGRYYLPSYTFIILFSIV